MITEWFISIGMGIAEWAVGLFGTADPPAYLTSLTTWLGTIINGASGFGAWVPWPFALLVAGVSLTLWLAGFVIKGIRWLIGLIPTMGGG